MSRNQLLEPFTKDCRNLGLNLGDEAMVDLEPIGTVRGKIAGIYKHHVLFECRLKNGIVRHSLSYGSLLQSGIVDRY